MKGRSERGKNFDAIRKKEKKEYFTKRGSLGEDGWIMRKKKRKIRNAENFNFRIHYVTVERDFTRRCCTTQREEQELNEWLLSEKPHERRI
jgi:hypothetical protein